MINFPSMGRFLDFLENDCKIYKPYYFSEKTEADKDIIKLRTYNSCDLENIFENISRKNLHDILMVNESNETSLIRSLFVICHRIYLVATNKRYVSKKILYL